MTPQERSDQIAKALYMNQIPDIWKLMAETLMVSHLMQVRLETIEECAKVTEPFNCLAITEAIRQLKNQEDK